MLQRYKVRLGDGTVLQVDLDGLRAWQTDGRAMVQVAGTQAWRPLLEVLADEESAARLARALVPPEPRRAPAPSPGEAPPSPPAELSIGEPPLVQALADEPVAPVPPWREEGKALDEAPAIRLKPLEDEPPRFPVPWARREEEEEEEKDTQDQRHDRLEGPLLQVIETFGALLSRCLDPLTPLARRWTSRSTEEPTPPHPRPAAPSTARRPPPVVSPPPRVRVLAEEPGSPTEESGSSLDRFPVIPLRPLDDAGRAGATKEPALSDRVSAWIAGLKARVGRLRDRMRTEGLVAPSAPAARIPPAPAPRAPLEAPPPIRELPVLRLAEEVHEPREAEDVYEGEYEAEEGEGAFPALWLWAKRVFLVGALVAAGVVAALNWESWFPRAAEMGQTVFTEIDRQARSGRTAREREQALTEAIERLPHLAPATVRLVLSTASSGVLDPPEVFQLANEAADRGRRTLAPAEAAELRVLQHELLSHLRPPERARLAEYDRARANRVVFPFENPHALEIVARGARAMSPATRERLQALLGKAVAAGLEISAAPAGRRPR
jgi:hypothetical protein